MIRKGSSDLYIMSTFQSLAQAVIPAAYYFQNVSIKVEPGALELRIYDYILAILDQSISPKIKRQMNVASMAKSTAQLLDNGAVSLMQSGENINPLTVSGFPFGGPFTYLSQIDRLKAISLIDRLEINKKHLSLPYKDNLGLIKNMMDVLKQLTLFGFYSEWNGYGSSAALSPEHRRLEHFPLGWQLTQYPGPSYAYRDLRGFIAFMPKKGRG
ncbi:hypothetical protein CEQ21_24965 [Niallia circulans]|uniref:Uncharacterized protein n=1 Tax=Niallia circulans TaxID=1397 RepID=A0A553SNS0_NIACI|nr:hypothetical protein [Niallia circulans]TRZ38621.1 hypothetical protein CEQ21_24965 [Niallia circulans]